MAPDMYPPSPAPTCSNGVGDDPTFVDAFGYDCAGWAGGDCTVTSAITELATCVATDGSALAGGDGVPCEVGGYGPDSGGYYYSASYMFNVRTSCTVSCDYCPDSNPTCVDSTTFVDAFGYNCAGWAGGDCTVDSAITDPNACLASDGSTLAGGDGVPCEVGGYGPDSGGYYYSATYMFNVRYNCPVSCFFGCE